MEKLTWPAVFATLVASALTYSAVQATWRVFFHPLTKFPGPLLAATSYWYRAYYDIVKDGGWSAHLEELHDVHGELAVLRSLKLTVTKFIRPHCTSWSQRGQSDIPLE